MTKTFAKTFTQHWIGDALRSRWLAFICILLLSLMASSALQLWRGPWRALSMTCRGVLACKAGKASQAKDSQSLTLLIRRELFVNPTWTEFVEALRQTQDARYRISGRNRAGYISHLSPMQYEQPWYGAQRKKAA